MSNRPRRVRLSSWRPATARVLRALVGDAFDAPPALRWLLLLPLAVGCVLLVYFHALLFWQRLSDLTLFEPGVALHWLGSLALLFGSYMLRRRGVPLLWGRRAAVLWLLVLLLHVSLPAPVHLEPATLFEPDSAASGLLVLPAAAGLALLAVRLLRALRRAFRRAAAGPAARHRVRPGPPRLARVSSGFASARFARPPPLAPQH